METSCCVLFGHLPLSLKFTFTENGWGAHSLKIAPRTYSLKLAGEPFFYQNMSCLVGGIVYLGIRWKWNRILVQVNFNEMVQWPLIHQHASLQNFSHKYGPIRFCNIDPRSEKINEKCNWRQQYSNPALLNRLDISTTSPGLPTWPDFA